MVVRGHAEVLVGRTIDRKYLIEQLLGTGSMGAVYRAHQIALDRTVAIKVMSADLASDPDFAERFHREAKAASRLAHPSSVGVTDFGADGDGLLYLVMEYIPGKNLDVVIQEEFPLDERRIANILSQVLSAVASAHDLGIVHRDLKPENILVVPSVDDEGSLTDIVKVCDFGIAKMLGVEDVAPSSPRGSGASEGRKLTAFGAVLGTPAYMSPEQGQGLPPEPRSDLYAIGGMLFEMLTKRIPFDLDAPEDLVRAHMVQPVPDPRDLVPACSPTLAEVCVRALQKSPEARFATARTMRSALRRALQGVDRDEESAPLSALPLARGGRGTDASLPPAELTTAPTDLPAQHDAMRATLPAPAPARALRRTWSLRLAGGIGLVAVAALSLASRSSRPARETNARFEPSAAASAMHADGSQASREPNRDDAPVAPTPVLAAAAALGDEARPRPSTAKEAGAEVTHEKSTAPHASGQVVPTSSATGQAAALVVAPPDPPVAVLETAAPAAPAAPAPTVASPTVAAPPSEQAPAVMAAAPYSPERAQVVVTVSGATGTSRAILTALVSHVSFGDCYRTALRGLGSAQGGHGTMHVEIDEDGVVQGVSARLPGPLSSATSCFVGRMQRQRLVRPPDTGAATGDLDLELSP